MKTMLRQTYQAGTSEGVAWAEHDRANSIPAAHEIALLEDESRSDQRWARAFYLGALRGYRSVARTKLGGRWGL